MPDAMAWVLNLSTSCLVVFFCQTKRILGSGFDIAAPVRIKEATVRVPSERVQLPAGEQPAPGYIQLLGHNWQL